MKSPRRSALFVLLIAGALLAGIWGAASDAAILRFDGLELRAEGDFRPHALPRSHPAPIEFEGSARLRSTVGGLPPQLRQVILEFDHDGRLSTRGLPTCDPRSIEHASVAQARRRCADAIVGTGQIGAMVPVEGRWLRVVGELTLFNGPPDGVAATVIAHAQPLSVPNEIYVVTIPIVRIPGEYRYRATVEVPEVFNGEGVLTDIRAKIGRRYRFHGAKRSYVSARCSDGGLSVHGHLTFSDSTIIDGSIEKYCVPKG